MAFNGEVLRSRFLVGEGFQSDGLDAHYVDCGMCPISKRNWNDLGRSMGGIERAIGEFMKKRRYKFVGESFCQLLKPIEGARFVEPHLALHGN